jgi:hypothetical protein
VGSLVLPPCTGSGAYGCRAAVAFDESEFLKDAMLILATPDAADGRGLRIVDVSAPEAPREVASLDGDAIDVASPSLPQLGGFWWEPTERSDWGG